MPSRTRTHAAGNSTFRTQVYSRPRQGPSTCSAFLGGAQTKPSASSRTTRATVRPPLASPRSSFFLKPRRVDPPVQPRALGPVSWHVAVATPGLVRLELGQLRLPAKVFMGCFAALRADRCNRQLLGAAEHGQLCHLRRRHPQTRLATVQLPIVRSALRVDPGAQPWVLGRALRHVAVAVPPLYSISLASCTPQAPSSISY
jgi:hypothetical protein